MHVLNYESANKPPLGTAGPERSGATRESGFVGSPVQRSSNYVLRGRP